MFHYYYIDDEVIIIGMSMAVKVNKCPFNSFLTPF